MACRVRYLQLRQPELQAALKLRALVTRTVRKVLDRDAAAVRVYSRGREFQVKRNRMYALPQSPQQYKQLLMSGVHKYYQILACVTNKNFFTFSEDWLVEFNEATSFPHDLQRGHGKYGIDKPDRRYACTISEVSEHASSPNSDFPVCEILHIAKEDAPASLDFLSDARLYNYRLPDVIRITEENVSSWNQPLRSTNLCPCLWAIALASTGQAVSYENPTPLGRARQLLVKQFPDIWRLPVAFGELPPPQDTCWIVDFRSSHPPR
ncbi:hypothetical protein CJU89_2413 [Yarrowia sp. B02]|nr:hypothetical protein CJU89_2413 [Yarrowia sp. B02]